MADNRIGDHIWWVTDVRKFQRHYPHWNCRYDLRGILREIHDAVSGREANLSYHNAA
jgi:CDP-paratose 2-epimerase